MLQNVGGDIVKEPTQNARETLSDINLEELVLLAKQGDKDALERVLNELTGMVRAVARSYFFLGADSDDVIQEGMIGLFMAVMNFEKSYSNGFYNFARTCVTNRILSAGKSAARKKHSPLNFYISVDHSVSSDEYTGEISSLAAKDHEDNPEHLVIRREDERLIRLDLQDLLTPLEQRVLFCYLQGMSYKEISHRLGKTQKSVSNAVFRVKRKLRAHYAKNDI